MKHSLIYLVTMGKAFPIHNNIKGNHFSIYKKDKRYKYLQSLFVENMVLYTALLCSKEKETKPYNFSTTIYPVYQIIKKFKDIYNLDFLSITYEE